ncbi:MAG: hypothetical protein E4G97_05835 [Deltaproteobacteria bacterium]|jgi:hypothetical protein|nr:MAG: hypothetical protein E4G97_05835 [Deltaproteobacteria bacterium]
MAPPYRLPPSLLPLPWTKLLCRTLPGTYDHSEQGACIRENRGIPIVEKEKGMNSRRTAFAILAAAFLLAGCLYSNVVAPLSTDLNKTSLGNKEGRASTHSVLWLVSWGDAGVAAAAKNGGLTTVNHMDVEIRNILFGLYTKETTIVYGD